MEIKLAALGGAILMVMAIVGGVSLPVGPNSTSTINLATAGNTSTKFHAPESCAIILTSPPNSVEDDQLVNETHVFAFHESTTNLTSSVDVDITTSGTFDSQSDLTQGTINNTKVNSYLIHFDPGTEWPDDRRFVNCTFSFDEDVIAVILSDGTLSDSDSVLGADQTDYPNVWYNRGLEFQHDSVIVDMQSDNVTVDFGVISPMDEIRVITEKPEPQQERTRLITEEVVTKNLHFSAEVSNLTVLETPKQTTFLKEASCLVQDSDAWQANRQARMEVKTGNETTIHCSGAKPTFNSTEPMRELPPGTEIQVTTNDGGVYEVDLWLQIRVNQSKVITNQTVEG